MDWTYGVRIACDGGNFVATARDLPEVLTAASTEEKARRRAAEAIDTAVAHRLERGLPLDLPSLVEEGEAAIGLPLQTAAKASLYLAWRKCGRSKSEVARRMGVQEGEVRRILSPRHGTRLGAIEAAARVMGGENIHRNDALGGCYPATHKK